MVKLLRAAGGCLGIDRRRRTCYLTKSFGELEGVMIRRYPNGGTRRYKTPTCASEYIGCTSELSELKHLSRRRKRNQYEITSVAASEEVRA